MSTTFRSSRVRLLIVAVLFVFSIRVHAQDGGEPLDLPPLEWLETLTPENFSTAQPVLTITGPNAFSLEVSEDRRYFQYYTYTRLSTRWGPIAYDYTTFDAQTYEQVPDSRINSPEPYYVVFDRDTNSIIRYDTATGEETQVLFEAQRGLNYGHFIRDNILYSPQTVTCGGAPCMRWFTWDITTGEPGKKFEYEATTGGYSPLSNSDRVLTAYCAEYSQTRECLRRVIEVFSLSQGQLKQVEFAPDRWLSRILFTPDMNKVFFSFGENHSVILYDANTLEQILQMPDAIYTMEFSPDSALLAAGTIDGSLILYETENYTEVRRWKSHRNAVTNITWHENGQMLATGGGLIVSATTSDMRRSPSDSFVSVWDVNTGTQLNTYDAGATSVNSVAFSPDGRFLMIAAGPNGEDGSGGQVTFVGFIGAEACRVQANVNANLRSGPGTGFGVTAGLAKGESALSDRAETDSDGYVWWHLVSGGWIREDLALPGENCGDLPDSN